MKEQFMRERIRKGSIWGALGLSVILPIGRLLLKQVGYELLPGNEIVYAGICGVVFVLAVCTAYRRDADEELEVSEEMKADEGRALVRGKTCVREKLNLKEIGFICLPLLVLWHLISFFILSETAIAKVVMFVVTILGVILSEKLGRDMWLRNAGITIAIIALIFIGFVGGISLLWGGSVNAVEKTVFSTEGTYYAQVLSNNQGALGGATYVDVYETREIPLLVYRIERAPRRIYHGRWGEFENMEIYFKREDCVIINGVEYGIE